MLKLMKYEFKKQAWSKAIILFLAAILEIAFILGIFMDSDNLQGFGFGFLGTLAIGAITYVGFECVDTFSKDLKTKCSYMLFLTPHTSYTIIGAKILTSAIQVFVTGFVFFGIFVLNGSIMMTKYGTWQETIEFIRKISVTLFHFEVDLKNIALFVLTMLIGWLFLIVFAFFAITLSTTFLATKKYKGFVSFLIFIVIAWLISFIQEKLFGTLVINEVSLWCNILYLLVVTTLAYIATAFMLDKKVSL